MTPATTLISTVGTSLFATNLERLSPDDADPVRAALAAAYRARRWREVARHLRDLPADDRVCGAEINSIASLERRRFVAPDANLVFCHSESEAGRNIAAVLREYYEVSSERRVELVEIEGLQDADPRRFRTEGLRCLAKKICRVIRDYGASACAVNATGGYKAQIAIAVMMGQAIGVPVYYKHERFDEVISFPPLPVALDFDVWMRFSGVLTTLDRDPVPAQLVAEEWDERFESLVERVEIDGVEWVELSPAGQIFHETFRERFRSQRDRLLPPAVPPDRKGKTRTEDAGWPGEHPEIQRFFDDAIREVPQVAYCQVFYFNPDLPERTRFRLSSRGIEGIFSNGSYCARAHVHTSARTDAERNAVLAALNEWLASR